LFGSSTITPIFVLLLQIILRVLVILSYTGLVFPTFNRQTFAQKVKLIEQSYPVRFMNDPPSLCFSCFFYFKDQGECLYSRLCGGGSSGVSFYAAKMLDMLSTLCGPSALPCLTAEMLVLCLVICTLGPNGLTFLAADVGFVSWSKHLHLLESSQALGSCSD